VPNIPNPETLSEATWYASIGLQVTQDIVGLQERDDAKVRFPRGYLRASDEGRQLFPFVERYALRANLGYTIQLADVHTWVLTRTDISNIAKDMMVKSFITIAGSVAEAILANHYLGQTGWRQTFVSRAERLIADGVIDARLRDELVWLWELRCRQHVVGITDSEFNQYSPNDFPRARAALNDLIGQLAANAGHALTCRAV
jgi:hypothetical protein